MSPRPHIETHNRAKGHSAVAGAAYRLGIAITDERTGTRHDFRRKSGVLVAHHLAPKDAPGWQADARQFWNVAEGAERRKDAQVARDYRIPVPLGFSQQAAEALALDVAQVLMRELSAPVSVALHRDNARDRFGTEKTEPGRGFHAHIYIPARGVALDGMEAKKAGPFLGLTNCNHSGAILERWNAAWAEACNRHAGALGLPPVADHRSLARMGVERLPEPCMGVSATAMERRGVATDRGDDVRHHMDPPTAMGRSQAIADQARERKAPSTQSRATPATVRPSLGRTRRPGAPRSTGPATGDRSGREAIQQIDERNALLEAAARELDAQRDEEAAARGKWLRELEAINELEQRGDKMNYQEMTAEQLDTLHRVLTGEAAAIHDWISDHRGDETKRRQAWQAADERFRRARMVRDEWVRKNPEPGALAFWKRQAWEEGRQKAQEPVEKARAERKEAARCRTPEALAVLFAERAERERRAQEIAGECGEINQRLLILQPTQPKAEEAGPHTDTDHMPTLGLVGRWRRDRKQEPNAGPQVRGPRR